MLSTRPRQRTERVTKQIPTTNEALKTDEESMLTLSFVLHLAVFFYYSSATLVRCSSCDARKKEKKIKRHESHLPLQERDCKIAAKKMSRVAALVADKTTGNHFLFPQTHSWPEQDTKVKDKQNLGERVMMELLPSRCQCRDNERDVRSAQVRYAD